MDKYQAMQARHSVRQYKNQPLEPSAAAALQQEIAACNREGGLHIQLVANESRAFDGLMAPTAMNQQKFTFTLKGDKVRADAGLGFYAKVDLGIVKYHFELGAQRTGEVWVC